MLVNFNCVTHCTNVMGHCSACECDEWLRHPQCAAAECVVSGSAKRAGANKAKQQRAPGRAHRSGSGRITVDNGGPLGEQTYETRILEKMLMAECRLSASQAKSCCKGFMVDTMPYDNMRMRSCTCDNPNPHKADANHGKNLTLVLARKVHTKYKDFR